MFKKLAVLVILVSAVAFSGCGKKFNCENVCAKNKKCADALAKVMTEGMPEAVKKKAAESIKKSFAGEKCVKQCKKSMDAKDDASKKMKKKMEECFKKSGCDDYAKCIKNMAK